YTDSSLATYVSNDSATDSYAVYQAGRMALGSLSLSSTSFLDRSNECYTLSATVSESDSGMGTFTQAGTSTNGASSNYGYAGAGSSYMTLTGTGNGNGAYGYASFTNGGNYTLTSVNSYTLSGSDSFASAETALDSATSYQAGAYAAGSYALSSVVLQDSGS